LDTRFPNGATTRLPWLPILLDHDGIGVRSDPPRAGEGSRPAPEPGLRERPEPDRTLEPKQCCTTEEGVSSEMASPELKKIDETYRWYRAAVDALQERSRVEGTPFGIDEYRRLDFFALTAEPDQVDYVHVSAGAVPAIWAAPVGAAKDRAVAYFHGGAYAQGSAANYRRFCGHLAKAVGCRVLIVDYRLAPENPHPAAVSDAVTAYRWLLEQGFDPGQLAVAGDSSGGGLAFATLLALKQRELPLPAGSVPISPWTDMRGTSPSLKSQEGIDLLVSAAALRAAADTFLSGGDPLDPLASPVLGDYAGITTPIYVQVGGNEALRDEAIATVEQARRGGVDATVEVFPGMQHVFQQGAGRIPESDEALQKVGRFLTPLLKL
jgi:acetyl esterase/lipase